MVNGARLFLPRCSGTNFPNDWDFFVTSYSPQKGFYCQDTVHILAKLRTKLITASNLLVLGTENSLLCSFAIHCQQHTEGKTRSNSAMYRSKG